MSEKFSSGHLEWVRRKSRFGPGREDFLQQRVYSTSQLEPSMGDRLMNVETLPQRGWTDFDTTLNVVERELGKGPYLFGDWFTAADVMIGSILGRSPAWTPVE